MITVRRIGVSMNHAIAHLIEFSNAPFEVQTLESTFTNEDKKESLTKSESSMHNKENQLLKLYYKKLADVIRNYQEVLLFGPTDAKTELFNILMEDHRFAKAKIEVKNTDQMTRNEMHAFVNEYFSKNK